MLLAIDAGNTTLGIGLFRAREMVAACRVATLRERTADEYGILLANLLAARGIDSREVRAAAVSCVVPPLAPRLQEALRTYFRVDPLFVEPGIRTGIAVVAENPQEVGADRIVNAVAAHARCRSAAIVVDFGTATTFDAVSAQAEYLGGAIAPGIEIGAEALFLRAARLPRVEIRRPPRVIGRNTVHSMQSGLVYGYVGLVRWIVARMKEELGGEVRVFATGGYLDLLLEELSGCVDEAVPHLTLEGLRLVHERNR